MKILQINCVYKQGSTGKIVDVIHKNLVAAGHESIVCYGRGEKIYEPNVYKTCGEIYSKANNMLSRFTGLMYGGCALSTNKLISVIKNEKPDIVHLHCINGYFVNIYRLLNWLKRNRIKTVLTMHAEFMYTANCGYALDCEKWRTGCGDCPRLRRETKSFFIDGTARSWKKMKQALANFDGLIITAVSPWLAERAAQSPIMSGTDIRVVLNGLDTEVFKPGNVGEQREKFGFDGGKIVFHATPNFSADPMNIKGGYYVLEAAKRLEAEKIKFVVAGKYDGEIAPPENLSFVGQISDQTLLAEYYSLADVTVLTSQKETFSMITAESLSCGTPIVGFKAGAPEQIALQEHSKFVEWGNTEALCGALREFLAATPDKKKIGREAAEKYSAERMCCGYMEIYKELCTGEAKNVQVERTDG